MLNLRFGIVLMRLSRVQEMFEFLHLLLLEIV